MFCFHATTSAGQRDALTSCVRSHGMLLRTIGSKPSSRGCGSTDASNCRSSPDHEQDPWYDADHQTRRVRSSGEIKLNGELIFVSEALVDQLVGIAELETGDHVVRFCGLDIGLIDRRDLASGTRRGELPRLLRQRLDVRVARSRRPRAAKFHSPRAYQTLPWIGMDVRSTADSGVGRSPSEVRVSTKGRLTRCLNRHRSITSRLSRRAERPRIV